MILLFSVCIGVKKFEYLIDDVFSFREERLPTLGMDPADTLDLELSIKNHRPNTVQLEFDAFENQFNESLNQVQIQHTSFLEFSIYDCCGKRILSKDISLDKQMIEIKVSTQELMGDGLYYYYLRTDKEEIKSKFTFVNNMISENISHRQEHLETKN